MLILKKIYDNPFVKLLLVLGLLYFFLSAITMMSTAFKLLGKDFSKGLVDVTASPIVALFIGVLTTAVVQSSSVTTSMVVGLVSAGTLTVASAVPMIMGANIGTTITSVLVSLGHMGNKYEFRRAFAGATMHDIFNLITVLVLFPLELMTGYLRKMAGMLSSIIYGTTDTTIVYHSPIKAVSKIIPNYIKHLLVNDWQVTGKLAGIICLVLAFAMIFITLFYLVKVMRSLMMSKAEKILNEFLKKSAIVGIIIGTLITVMVQSSSITTSLLVPMIGAGILAQEAAFPITMGANLGTTITALLAALVGNMAGLTIALVHLLFNFTGILLIYPLKQIRRIPIFLSIRLSKAVTKDKKVALYYILGMFFILPGIFIAFDKLF